MNVIQIDINKPKTTKSYDNNKNLIYHEIFETKSFTNKRNNIYQNNLSKYNLLIENILIIKKYMNI